MKILHVCLANPYMEGYGYQENILPCYHVKDGHDVVIFTSDKVFDKNFRFTKRPVAEYVNSQNIKVKILEKAAYSKLWFLKRDFEGLYDYIETESPNVIFVHGPQFRSLKDIKKYKKHHSEVKVFIDNHADYYNTRVKKLSKKIAHWFFYGHTMRSMAKDVEMFWGVTPWRCDFLHRMYGVPKEKIDLLVMGGDDDEIHFENREDIKRSIRQKYDIADEDFLIITGGKIDKTKNMHLLVDAVKAIGRDNVKLLIFGQPTNEFKETFLLHINDAECIRYIGWIDYKSVYDYFLASDLCAFPGTHSVLWEQACACGLPGIYKSWEGMQHVDLDGSVLFLTNDTLEEIKGKLLEILDKPEQYKKMKKAAQRGITVFSYREISRRAINGDK